MSAGSNLTPNNYFSYYYVGPGQLAALAVIKNVCGDEPPVVIFNFTKKILINNFFL